MRAVHGWYLGAPQRWLCRACGLRQLLGRARRRPIRQGPQRSLTGDGCARLRSKHQQRQRGTKTSVQAAALGRTMATCSPTTADYALLWGRAPRGWPALPYWPLVRPSATFTTTCTMQPLSTATGPIGRVEARRARGTHQRGARAARSDHVSCDSVPHASVYVRTLKRGQNPQRRSTLRTRDYSDSGMRNRFVVT